MAGWKIISVKVGSLCTYKAIYQRPSIKNPIYAAVIKKLFDNQERNRCEKRSFGQVYVHNAAILMIFCT